MLVVVKILKKDYIYTTKDWLGQPKDIFHGI